MPQTVTSSTSFDNAAMVEANMQAEPLALLRPYAPSLGSTPAIPVSTVAEGTSKPPSPDATQSNTETPASLHIPKGAKPQTKSEDPTVTPKELEDGVASSLRSAESSARRVRVALKRRSRPVSTTGPKLSWKAVSMKEYPKEVKRRITASRVQNTEIDEAGESPSFLADDR